jgi:transcriptional regulator with XRE-family HTH domain
MITVLKGREEKMENKGQGQDRHHSWRLRVQSVAQEHGFDQEQLAATSGLPLNQIQALWENASADVSLSTLDRIAGILGVGINDLIEDVDETHDQHG